MTLSVKSPFWYAASHSSEAVENEAAHWQGLNQEPSHDDVHSLILQKCAAPQKRLLLNFMSTPNILSAFRNWEYCGIELLIMCMIVCIWYKYQVECKTVFILDTSSYLRHSPACALCIIVFEVMSLLSNRSITKGYPKSSATPQKRSIPRVFVTQESNGCVQMHCLSSCSWAVAFSL